MQPTDKILFTSVSIEELANVIRDKIIDDIDRAIARVTSLPEYPTVKQAAMYTGLSQVSIYDRIRKGHLNVEKIGSRTRLRRSEVLSLFKEVDR